MKHGISEQEWNDYLDQRAAAAVRDRIEAHFIGCLECWQFYEQMNCATQVLQEAAEEARQRVNCDDRQLHKMLRGVFSRLRSSADTPARTQVEGRLNVLETLFAPFCGTRVAASALEAAAKTSPAQTLEKVTSDNWQPFLERLTAIAAAVGGETFAGLIWERGQF